MGECRQGHHNLGRDIQWRQSICKFYFIGFKSAAPEFTLRTRIWASLRAQTLQDRFWHDELLEGHQTSLPCREPRSRAVVRWQYAEALTRTGTHGHVEI